MSAALRQLSRKPLGKVQLSDCIFTPGSAKSFIESRYSQHIKPRWSITLQLANSAMDVAIIHGKRLPLQATPLSLAHTVLLSLDAWLHKQRNGSTKRKSEASHNDDLGHVLHYSQCGSTATHKLHQVQQNIKAVVKPLVSLVKPVTVLDIKQGIFTHKTSFDWVISALAEVAVKVDETAVFETACRIPPTSTPTDHFSCLLPDAAARLLFGTPILAQRRGACTPKQLRSAI